MPKKHCLGKPIDMQEMACCATSQPSYFIDSDWVLSKPVEPNTKVIGAWWPSALEPIPTAPKLWPRDVNSTGTIGHQQGHQQRHPEPNRHVG